MYNLERLDENYELVETLTLDEFCTENSIEKLDIIKVDVEGAEYEVINGMKTSISKFMPIIIMEMNHPIQEKRGISTIQLKQSILNYGYNCYNIKENGRLEESAIDFVHNIDNVLFVPKEKIEIIQNILD